MSLSELSNEAKDLSQGADALPPFGALTAVQRLAKLQEAARALRVSAIKTIATAGMGHVGGDLSVSDILATLFFGVLNLDPKRPNWPGRIA